MFNYDSHSHEKEIFGAAWCGPETYTPRQANLVAKYPVKYDDGQPVEVYCTPMPARFYRLRVLEYNGQSGYEITTGSSMADLAATMADAISEGMLGFYPVPLPPPEDKLHERLELWHSQLPPTFAHAYRNEPLVYHVMRNCAARGVSLQQMLVELVGALRSDLHLLQKRTRDTASPPRVALDPDALPNPPTDPT